MELNHSDVGKVFWATSSSIVRKKVCLCTHATIIDVNTDGKYCYIREYLDAVWFRSIFSSRLEAEEKGREYVEEYIQELKRKHARELVPYQDLL